jgi:membrane associated rhomboid family serine protease
LRKRPIRRNCLMAPRRTFSLSLPPFTKAVKWLILVNAGVYLLVTLLQAFAPGLGDVIGYVLSLVPRQIVFHGWVWQLATYSFLHVGIFHILFNMIALWMFGAQFESDWGTRKFLEFYFFCVIGAALTTIAVSFTGFGGVTPSTSTVGASGGVLGILMAFGMVYGEQEIMLFPIPISMKAKYFVGGLVFIEIISALSAANPSHHGEAVAYVAHLGGLLFGFLYVKMVSRRGIMFGVSERYFGIRNGYYRWKRRRAARKFEVYMRKHDRTVTFDEHGNYIPPEESKKNGGSKSGWVN